MSLKKYLTEAELAAVQPITGDEFDISIRELTNIETVVLEHTEGSITIALDETAMKMLEHCGCTFEDEDEEDKEQVDELAPVIGAIGGALGRGVAAGAGALARGAAKAVVGTGIKAAADKLDKTLFGPKSNEEEYDESLNDIRRLSGIKIDELSPAAKKAYVKHATDKGNWFRPANYGSLAGIEKDRETAQTYASNPTGRSYDPRWAGIEKNLKTKYDRRALNVNKVQGQLSRMGESEFDTSSGSPYDRGAADSYYGRDPRPHKIVPYTGADAVKGQMQKVPLTDPAEIAAYNAGYSENDDRKDYGEGIENWDMRVTSIPRTEPFKLKKIVVTSKYGKTYTFDTENDARRHFGKNWDKVTDPEWRKANGWKLDMSNTKAEIGLDEAEYQGRKVQLGKPMQGDVKKFKVYVKDPSTGNVKKVNFGDPNMRIRKNNPGARKNFRARHNCKNPGPRTKARYWSCRKW